MASKVKYLTFGYSRQAPEAHIEFPLGMIHIITGLHDSEGRNVTHISITPDTGAGDIPNVIFEGAGGRMIGLMRKDTADNITPYQVMAQTVVDNS